jgi:hypothetical protein
MKWLTTLLVLAWLITAGLSADEGEMAEVITGQNRAAQCISPVHIRKIDGREAAVNRMSFRLEPGVHSISGSAKIDASNCPAVGRGSNQHTAGPLEANFEAGKTYFVGYDHSSGNRNDWKLVIWKVKD